VLAVELPFASKEDVSLSRNGDSLVLQVGSWRRNLVLPRLLLDAPTQGAKMEDRVLKVRFAAPRTMTGGSRNG
jgi:arsenite-transporting ATPase